jgi:hypothetical protein
MGEAGRAFALSRFDANVMLDALEKLYQEGMSTKRGTGVSPMHLPL